MRERVRLRQNLHHKGRLRGQPVRVRRRDGHRHQALKALAVRQHPQNAPLHPHRRQGRIARLRRLGQFLPAVRLEELRKVKGRRPAEGLGLQARNRPNQARDQCLSRHEEGVTNRHRPRMGLRQGRLLV